MNGAAGARNAVSHHAGLVSGLVLHDPVLWAVAHWAGNLAVRKLGGWGWVLVAFGV
jgi:hypothetical protein